ncbi:type IV pilus biogenesis protein PilP [Halomonas elongata]|uniref:type IV pilus biogenesis protein PilP n=1 Tax=Halomonas elongata TaxID=2746 RepID=UPI00255B1DCA|nr:type IV pilus biogenesis protein PilP [Halomonas elongata]MDL4860763.1 type IV pilus biogenesis protein PilP [Halomonas elongata]
MSTKKRLKAVNASTLVACAVLVVGSVQAQGMDDLAASVNSEQEPQEVVSGTLDAISSSNRRLELMITNYQRRAQLAELRRQVQSGEAGAPISSVPGSSADSSGGLSGFLFSGGPVVTGVYGANGQLRADVMLPSGGELRGLKEGDQVYGGFTVSEISGGKVVLENKAGNQRVLTGAPRFIK